MNMKLKLGLLTALLALTVLPGCWTSSLQPLYKDGDPHLAYDPGLIGTWQTKTDSPLVITGDSTADDYALQTTDERGRYLYSGRLVQLGSYRFLDVVPSSSYDVQGRPQQTEPGYIPTHSILKVIIEGDSLYLIAPNDEQLCAAARDNKVKVGDCIDDDFVFTAQTGSLQEFFLKHADDLEIFDAKDPERALHRLMEKKGAVQ